jgi:hypothetical protein
VKVILFLTGFVIGAWLFGDPLARDHIRAFIAIRRGNVNTEGSSKGT